MRSVIVLLVSLLFSTTLSSITQATAAGITPGTAMDILSLSCLEAAKKGNKAASSRMSLRPGHAITLREDYVVQVFLFKGVPSEHRVVALIEKGPETDVETARISAICLDEQLQTPQGPDQHTIEFNGSTGDKIHIRFRLNKRKGDPAHLERHSWKPAGADSVWMSGPFAPGDVQHYPTANEWPVCLLPKQVASKGDNLTFDFDSCLTTGKVDLTYIYMLRLDRMKKDGTLETVTIDPQIINHPH